MRKKAYTLVEVLVTMMVLTLLASFIIPTYQLMLSQAQLASATTEITEILRLAEQKTVTEQVVYGVTLNTNAVTIPQYYMNGVSKVAQTTYNLPANMKIGSVNFSGQSDIRFSTSGAPNYSGSLVINDIIRNRNRSIDVKASGAIVNNQMEY